MRRAHRPPRRRHRPRRPRSGNWPKPLRHRPPSPARPARAGIASGGPPATRARSKWPRRCNPWAR
ncbi:MAG: hypothetical protein E2O52_09035 [Gammaproteobacteria bacterium]|nr:MAG: hypothetical protein E2O52_09035 [Gammaproteobacteria bacterium]